jgi:pilus assembly protein FimV
MVASESELADTDATMESDTIESSMEGETLESPTLDTLGAAAETTQMPGLEDPTSLEIDLSGLTDLPVDSDDLVDLETSVRTDEGDTDFGLDEGEAAGDTVAQPLVDAAIGDTAEQPILDDLTDTGVADDSQETSPVEDEAWSLPEDATMTEVGTKLDLARAYIDMGDPDGARSILNEVLDEGEDSQRQEARQLLAELDD